jgi:diaminopimelate epimerase
VVIPVGAVEAVDLERCGAALEVHPAFPARTNVHFVQVLAPDHLVMRVWERGAGPTLACGTGACATLVVCHRLGLCDRRARLDLPGGTLLIDWDPASDHLFMTGPAEAVFDAVITPALWGEEPPTAAPPLDDTPQPTDTLRAAVAEIDCATACVNGCVRPEACAAAEARARVDALLQTSSLDDLVALATQSLEARTRARAGQGGPPLL